MKRKLFRQATKSPDMNRFGSPEPYKVNSIEYIWPSSIPDS